MAVEGEDAWERNDCRWYGQHTVVLDPAQPRLRGYRDSSQCTPGYIAGDPDQTGGELQVHGNRK